MKLITGRDPSRDDSYDLDDPPHPDSLQRYSELIYQLDETSIKRKLIKKNIKKMRLTLEKHDKNEVLEQTKDQLTEVSENIKALKT
jgi:phage-related tail protein